MKSFKQQKGSGGGWQLRILEKEQEKGGMVGI